MTPDPCVVSRREILLALLAKHRPVPDDQRVGHHYIWRDPDGRERQIDRDDQQTA